MTAATSEPMVSIVEREYAPALKVEFTSDGWFCATTAAARFGKRPIAWLRLPETKRYIAALCRRSEVSKSHFIITQRGRSQRFTQGTWFHPKLAVPFARWIDADFAVWADEQIDLILRQQLTDADAQRMREIGVLWQQRLGLEAKDATSKAMASVGSKLMLDRRRVLPGLRSERIKLDAAMQPALFGRNDEVKDTVPTPST